MSMPRIIIAGLRGGGGKTLASLGLVAAWRKQGHRVIPFKKGPDYIDAAWLSMAAGRPCRNLDLFLMSGEVNIQSFVGSTDGADVAVVEGNRGLFDGMDAQGTCSTAELAKLLRCPVVLVVDCTKSTRTMAATILGCQELDPEVSLRGVVLNRIAGKRHEAIIRESIEQVCGIPVVGAIPRIPGSLFPERHLGLIPPQEHDGQSDSLEQVCAVAEQYLDLNAIWNIADSAPVLELAESSANDPSPPKPRAVRIGVFRDAAFQFYYPENFEALSREGAELVEISPLRDQRLPDVDALYIGGGFPETSAASLAGNGAFLKSVRQMVESGLPVYAECGGAVYLGEKLLVDQACYPMVGALPVTFSLHAKPQGHGYAVLEAIADNPFYARGESVRGHEFHYTCVESPVAEELNFALRVCRGSGFDGERDGLVYRNVLACYTHVHALGTTNWAPSVVDAAMKFKSRLDQRADKIVRSDCLEPCA